MGELLRRGEHRGSIGLNTVETTPQGMHGIGLGAGLLDLALGGTIPHGFPDFLCFILIEGHREICL